MILTDARTRTLRLLDDADGTKYNGDGTFAEVDAALTTAQVEVWQLVVAAGANIFNVETSKSSDATGLVDLSSLRPIKLVNVALSIGGQRYGSIKPARVDQGPLNYAGVLSLLVTYVPRATFPSAPANPFVWGNSGVDTTALFDTLMCAIAASELKIKEGEVNVGLEKRKDELRAAVQQTLSVPTWSVMPVDAYVSRAFDAGLNYIVTSVDKLQLVYPG